MDFSWFHPHIPVLMCVSPFMASLTDRPSDRLMVRTTPRTGELFTTKFPVLWRRIQHFGFPPLAHASSLTEYWIISPQSNGRLLLLAFLSEYSAIIWLIVCNEDSALCTCWNTVQLFQTCGQFSTNSFISSADGYLAVDSQVCLFE